MPLYIPWLTETIKKRGVRYLLHHYLGQFFEEKLTLEQLSIDIYEGRGSISNLALDVDGLNDELDFIPFKFLDGCSIDQISVEVPWSSLATEACRVELEGAKFVCQLKSSVDGNKAHCTESTLLSRSLMTSSMQMAEDIVTTEDDEDYDSPSSSLYKHSNQQSSDTKKKDNAQMFEGLEMFAQLIDSVLRRTKLTAYNTLFRIQPQPHNTGEQREGRESGADTCDESDDSQNMGKVAGSISSENWDDSSDEEKSQENKRDASNGTVEFLIRFFRCEEIIDKTKNDFEEELLSDKSQDEDGQSSKKKIGSMPEVVTKLLTLEDVEMRIGGIPVSNLVGKHTIMIKFNGQKSEISIYSGSPLLAVIGHEQLKTFFRVFDSANERDEGAQSSQVDEKNQQVMSLEDYAKIENQLLEQASFKISHHNNQQGCNVSEFGSTNPLSHTSGRRWMESGDLLQPISLSRASHASEYQSYNANQVINPSLDGNSSDIEPSLDHIEAFSCELKLPGIWLCILKHGETIPPLIKPYADSINSFDTINKYIEKHIKVPHIRLLALKVSLDLTSAGINVFLGDLDIAEHTQNDSISPTLRLLQNDLASTQMRSERYRATIVNNKDVVINSLTRTRITIDPTLIDRLVFDYKLFHNSPIESDNSKLMPRSRSRLDLNFEVRGDQLKVELLCPIPDLTPEAHMKPTELRPQSFIFDLNDVKIQYKMDKFTICANSLIASVKTQPQQKDNEAVRFIESSSKNTDKIVLTLEPSPSNLDDAFPSEIDKALNESSMYDSIYVGRATESRIPMEVFQTKRKVVRPSNQDDNQESAEEKSHPRLNECDSEKILLPGDRQHLLDYINQTVMSTRLSITANLPICEIEFEDKEQLDLIYNRFGNDYVFWHPRAFSKGSGVEKNSSDDIEEHQFKAAVDVDSSDVYHDGESEVSFHSLSFDSSSSDIYANQVTCKITVDELIVKFNHQGCAAALKQEIASENVLMGIIIDVNKRSNTILSLVADNLELATDSETVLEGNSFNEKSSAFALAAEIKRPTKALKDIKLAIQLSNGLFSDFKTETYARFWQSISVTDETVLGYVAPKILTELHVDFIDSSLLWVKDGARPALFSVDELYLTSMMMEQTSQVMMRVIADEMSLYLKKNRSEQDIMKNYVCLIDSGLIDLDVKFSKDGRVEFGVINNKITIRACQDSLAALCKLFGLLVRNQELKERDHGSNISRDSDLAKNDDLGSEFHDIDSAMASEREMELLEDAMNDFQDSPAQSDGDLVASNSESEPSIPSLFSKSSCSSEVSESNKSSRAGSDSNESSDDTESMVRPGDLMYELPNPCLMDESNPMLGDQLTPPLVPLAAQDDEPSSLLIDPTTTSSQQQPSATKLLDESGFFVIGDDDVGAGIIDKQHQQEPIVRKLIEGPINVIENYFKMTRPRTIPEALVASVERYILEEMTLVVNLYGGRDFDDDSSSADETSSEANSSMVTDQQEVDADSVRKGLGSSPASSGAKSNRVHADSSSSSSGKLSVRRRSTQRKERLSEASSQDSIGRHQNSDELRVRFGGGPINLWESLDLMTDPDFLGTKKPTKPPLSAESKQVGGTWRENDVSIQLTLTKVKLLYEIADAAQSPISWRFMLFIHDIEIKDRIGASDINKILYEYCSESMPRRNTQLLTIKNIATINPSDGCEDCDLRVSLKPLRLNIDQDTLLFLIEFFTNLTKSLSRQRTNSNSSTSSTSTSSPNVAGRPASRISAGGHKSSGGSHSQSPNEEQTSTNRKTEIFATACDGCRPQKVKANQDDPTRKCPSRGNYRSNCANKSDERGSSKTETCPSNSTMGKQNGAVHMATTSCRRGPGENGDSLPTRCHSDYPTGSSAGRHQPIYIKSFTFSPDVPIRLDYHAKHLDFEQGALAGILMGLAHLDHSELVLRRIQAKHGMRGLDRVLLYALNHWIQDIKRNQLPSILSGVGPMHSVIQLFQGIRDLIWLPIEHYRRDKRLVRGIQRGAASFSSSTAMAAISLMNRFISIIQCTAQIAHDIVTPPTLKLSGGYPHPFELSCESPGHRHHRNRRRRAVATAAMPASSTNSRSTLGSSGGSSASRRQATFRGSSATSIGKTTSSGGTSGEVCKAASLSHHSIQALNQPRNFCEGVAVGFNIIREGFNDTARNVAMGMQADDMRSAVGELVRQIPSTLLNPIISATEGAQNVLVGMRNQIAPDARREDQDKWKRRIRGR